MKKYYYISLIFAVFFVLVFLMMSVAIVFLYPIKYKNIINENAKIYNLKPELIASVINVESGFKKDEVSHVGAMGLMQLMPLTAIEISTKLNDENFKVSDMFVPEKNIKYGCYYLRYLINKFDGNVTNALASYNAGFSNVNAWLLETKYSKDGVNLTKIPFKETKNYIRKVNKNLKIYENRL